MKKTKSLAHSIGAYMSNEIVRKHMPSLDFCGMTGKKVTTTWGECKEHERLNDAWFSKLNEEKYKSTKGLKGVERYKKEKEAQDKSKDEWNALMKYSYMLKERYLPHNIKCYIPWVDVSNKEIKKEILESLRSHLWGSDVCEYSLEEGDIDIFNEEGKFGMTYVTMKLCLKAPSSYTGKGWIEIKTKQKKI